MLLTSINLSARYRRLFTAAYAVALAGPGTCGRNRDSYKLGAIIHDGPTILTAGHNSYSTHPYLKRFTEFPYKHAECACLLALGKDQSQGKTMIVVRVRKDGHIANARPCSVVCQPMIKEFGIKEVLYTTNEAINVLF